MPELRGNSDSGWAVWGGTLNGTGVAGTAGSGNGTYGDSVDAYGVFGRSTNAVGVVGDTASQYTAVWGHNRGNGPGVTGSGAGGGTGVVGQSPSGRGVAGNGTTGVYANGSSYGVFATSGSRAVSAAGGVAVLAVGGQDGTGVYGTADPGGLAGYFNGPVTVSGNLTVVNGNKPFKMDHPLDPENRYLLHNAVESSERKNVYDGVVRLDEDGAAWVDLPEWFEALNGDFRYQLTAVGAAAPNLHVSEEISENRFKIAGGERGMKVCWQVTGTRKDPWAAANPFEAEEEKSPEDRGRYLQPDLYDAPEEQRVRIVPMVGPMEEERLRQTIRQEAPQAPEMPLSFEPPQPPAMPPGAPARPPDFDFGRMQEEHRQQIDELRGQIEELRRGRMEAEIDELRGQVKKLRRRGGKSKS
jgi:hypothetical protein